MSLRAHPLFQPTTRRLLWAAAADSASAAWLLTLAALTATANVGPSAAGVMVPASAVAYGVGSATVASVASRFLRHRVSAFTAVLAVLARLGLLVVIVVHPSLWLLAVAVAVFEAAKASAWTTMAGEVAARCARPRTFAWHGVVLTLGGGFGGFVGGLFAGEGISLLRNTAVIIGVAVFVAVAAAAPVWELLRRPVPAAATTPDTTVRQPRRRLAEMVKSLLHARSPAGVLSVGALTIAAGFGPTTVATYVIASRYGASWAGWASLVSTAVSLLSPLVASRMADWTNRSWVLPLFGLLVWGTWLGFNAGVMMMLAAVAASGLATTAFNAVQGTMLLDRVGPDALATANGARSVANQVGSVTASATVGALGVSGAAVVGVPALAVVAVAAATISRAKERRWFALAA
jgi:MFS family permease